MSTARCTGAPRRHSQPGRGALGAMALHGAACLLLLGTMSAATAQDCLEALTEVERSSREVKVSDALRRDLRQLRRAALLFLRTGSVERCESIAEGMRSLLEERQEQIELSQRLETLRKASALQGIAGIMTAEDLDGLTVRNEQDEELGVVEAIAIDPRTAEVAYLVLSSGGFLGLGERRLPVPWSMLRRTQDGGTLVLDVSTATLEEVPALDDGEWPMRVEERWSVNPS